MVLQDNQTTEFSKLNNLFNYLTMQGLFGNHDLIGHDKTREQC